MNKELAIRTIGYLIGYFNSHGETTINSQEVDAINYLTDENIKLEQENEQMRQEKDNLLKYLENKINLLERMKSEKYE